MAITREERRRMNGRRAGDRWRLYLRAVPTERAHRATKPGFHLTRPVVVGMVIVAAIIVLGAVALGNGGSVDLGPAGSWMRLMLPRAD